MNLGSSIRKLRRQAGKTQGVFAMECKISQTYLSQIESNKKDPNLATLKCIAEKLNTSLPVLFFLSMDVEDVAESKKEVFMQIEPIVKNALNELLSI